MIYRLALWNLILRGKDELLGSLSIRFVPSHIHSIFTVNTPILYLSFNKICQTTVIQFNNNKKDMRTSLVICIFNTFIQGRQE
jgi:hypothetical protein